MVSAPSPATCGGKPVAAWLSAPAKRLADLIIVIPLAVIAAPLVLLGVLAMQSTSPGSILYRQQRAGHHGVAFSVLKLRTMRHPRDDERDGDRNQGGEDGTSVSFDDDEERLTRVGRFLRRFSIDELPQLINVIRGEMSIVGPRPLPLQYVARYSDIQKCRLLARPGLTGLSQMTVRNAGTWEEKLNLDAEYVARASLRLDLGILLGTIRTVLVGTGVSAPGHATMPEFNREPTSNG